jgi:nitroreductase
METRHMTTSSTRTLPLSAPEAMEQRVSVRRYTPDALTDAEVNRLIDLASRAPSAFNVQPWRFVVVRDQAKKDQLMAAAYNQPQVGAAGAVFVLYSDMKDALATIHEVVHPGLPDERKEPTKQMILGSFEGKSDAEIAAWGHAQSYIALGYFLVAAQSLGYGTSPMGGFDPEAVKTLLGLPAHVTIPALVAVGHPAEAGFAQHRHPVTRISREAK